MTRTADGGIIGILSTYNWHLMCKSLYHPHRIYSTLQPFRHSQIYRPPCSHFGATFRHKSMHVFFSRRIRIAADLARHRFGSPLPRHIRLIDCVFCPTRANPENFPCPPERWLLFHIVRAPPPLKRSSVGLGPVAACAVLTRARRPHDTILSPGYSN